LHREFPSKTHGNHHFSIGHWWISQHHVAPLKAPEADQRLPASRAMLKKNEEYPQLDTENLYPLANEHSYGKTPDFV